MTKLQKDLIKEVFWKQTTDYNTSAFETDGNKDIINIAINIAKCQLPRHLVNDEDAIFQRCALLFRMGAFHWYQKWC